MLTTVEQKLSAIKAINIEIDHCEKSIEKIENFQIIGVESISLMKPWENLWNVDITPDLSKKLCTLLLEDYKSRKQQLFDKAQELMK